jgi:O-antigen/teichoic acid export membrane protein
VRRSAIILRNIASNWVGFGVNAAITLLLTPLILRELGTARYGIWILTSSLIGYYGLLDLGFRAGVTQYLTRYLAIGDHTKASECMSSAIAVLGALAALMVVLSVAAAYIAPHIFDLPGEMVGEAFWCILIVGCSSGIQFALSPFTSVFTAKQRFDLANLIGVMTRLLTAGGIAMSLKAGQGLVGISAVTCAVSVVDYVIRWRVAHRLAPHLSISRHRTSVKRLREIGSFGAWNFLISINAYVYQYVPNILIGSLMPISAVGHYALATALTRQINSVLGPVAQVIYPAATELHVQGDQEGLERLYHDSSRLIMLTMVSIVLIAAFWADDFYRLWIGGRYLSGTPFHSVAVLFQILLISVITNYSSSIAAQILISGGRVRAVAIALLCASILNLATSLALIGRYGLVGVAAATVVASVVVDLIAMPLLLQRFLGLSVAPFLRRSCVRPILVAALQSVLFAFIRAIGPADNWRQLISQGLLAAFGAVMVVFWVGITATERRRFVAAPLGRIFSAPRESAEATGH